MSKETYSIPIYENGVKTEWTVDGEMRNTLHY